MERSCVTCKFFIEEKRLDLPGFISEGPKLGHCGRPGIRANGILSTNATMNCELWKNSKDDGKK